MTNIKKLWSSLAYKWMLVVGLNLLLTPRALTLPAANSLAEILTMTEMPSADTPDDLPTSLVPEMLPTVLPVTAESPSSISARTFLKDETHRDKERTSLDFSTPPVTLEKASYPPVGSRETAISDTSSIGTLPETAMINSYTAPASSITTPDSVLILSPAIGTTGLPADVTDSTGNHISIEKPKSEVHTHLPTLAEDSIVHPEMSEAAVTSVATATLVDTSSPHETSTSAKSVKTEIDSASTVASSNAPATTTTNENQELITIESQENAQNGKSEEKERKEKYNGRQHETVKEQKYFQQSEDSATIDMSGQQQKMSATTEQQQQHQKQQEEQEQQEQQQPQQQQHQQLQELESLTTDVTRRTEEEMHKQATGNTEIIVTTSYIVGENAKAGVKASATATATSALGSKKKSKTMLTDPGNPRQAPPDADVVYESTIFERVEDVRPSVESKSMERKKTETQIVLDSLHVQTPATHSPKEDGKPHSLPDVEKQITLEDFKPLIQDANRRLLKERTIFTPIHEHEEEENWNQNLLPNEVDDYEHQSDPVNLYNNPYEHNINWSPYLHPATPVVDFTGKVLQEQDGVITEIEQKFRLNEFATEVGEKASDMTTADNKFDTTSTTFTTTTNPSLVALGESTKSMEKPLSITVNHEIWQSKDKQQSQQHYQKTPLLPLAHIAVVRPRHEFIERRVKKSFDFPLHRMASDAAHTMQHFDFANTKFSSNINEPMQHLTVTGVGAGTGAGAPNAGSQATVNQEHDTDAVVHVPRPQPEFSTTKFYNSKELYNEMLQHKNKQHQLQPLQHDKGNTNALNMQHHKDEVPQAPSLTLNSFAVLHSPKITKLEELHELHEPQKSLAIKRVTVQATQHKENPSADFKDQRIIKSESTASTTSTTSTTTTTAAIATTTTAPSTSTPSTVTAVSPLKKFHKELKKAKLLLKTMLPARQIIADRSNTLSLAEPALSSALVSDSITAAVAATPDPTGGKQTPLPTETFTSRYVNNPQTLTTIKPLETAKAQSESNTLTGNNERTVAASLSSFSAKTDAGGVPYASSTTTSLPAVAAYRPTADSVATYPTKPPLKPILRPRILTRLQEKINSLECEMPSVPQDSHLWRGNETHELLLPIMTPENCKTDKDCTSMMVSWEGEAEIQSGDILIVEVNDSLLNPKEDSITTSAHNTQVYQVTRSGHEHCDVTEGILLDITPLIVDGRKLVTLYDKDLTEGVNLLIVVSELWGSQCVRLKVTTKTENCGESSDCSGKGVCYSNADMEEYECQCCSGFAGPHCEEIDACTPSPCTNNGICVDLSQGHEGNSYQCLCPYGYTGKNCQYELDPCNPAECMNGGSCVGNSTHYRCDCSPGYTGPLCQHSLNECESSPCIHGICVDQEDGFRCFCQPGFAGELCNFEYNECESNPCQNGGECIDHIGSFECRCTKGYTGTRCQIKVDFCSNKPCPEGRRCIDHGNDFSCECPGGSNGPECNKMQRTQCNVNPCTHGGTCWSSGDSFYCACRPGYTGTMCEDEFVVETVVSSSEFMVDDTSARNFNDKSFGSSVVLKSPIELHNAYTAAIVLALVIFFVALYLTICHCKVNQTYRKFSTRTYGFLPIIGFRWRSKPATSKISRHWLSGKGLAVGNTTRDTSAVRGNNGSGGGGATNTLTSTQHNNIGHLPTTKKMSGRHQQQHQVGQLSERPFQRHLAMNLENDMYYTVDFSENSQHSPLIQ